MSEETIPQMREQIESLSKALKEATKEKETLASDNRRFAARDAFRSQGYAATHGDLFAAQNPDGEISAEAIDAFVTKYNLPKADSGGAAEEQKTETADGGEASSEAKDLSKLAQMGRGGSRAGDSSGAAVEEPMTIDQWQELHANDPAAAREAVAKGQVRISSGNPFGDARSVAPGQNPYLPSGV